MDLLLQTSLKVPAHVAFDAYASVASFWREFWVLIGPGGKLHPQTFLDAHGHIVIELLLVLTIAVLLFQRSFKPSAKNREPLTEREIDELCEEWVPEPLESNLDQDVLDWEPPVVESTTGRQVTVAGRKVLNFTSYDYLGLSASQHILDAAKQTINKYGVGSCGPRGFYGTIDVHLHLEDELAKFMDADEAIIYSYDLATVPSVLPAFANRKDVIVVDRGANYAIQNACELSRAKIVYFNHNDPEDLERKIQEVLAFERKKKKPLNRRFVVVEGIYANYGDVAPLDKIFEIKQKYKFRLLVDESLSFGVLGKHGRGACEMFDLPLKDVEIICASMGNALASVGGFCVGSREIVDHQRLSGIGYCFSASLPPFLATAASKALQSLNDQHTTSLPQLLTTAAKLRTTLSKWKKGLVLRSSHAIKVSPVIHLELDTQLQKAVSIEKQVRLLQQIADFVLEQHGVLVAVHQLSGIDVCPVAPSIVVVVTLQHTADDLKRVTAALQAAQAPILPRHKA